ncbi:MAG: hypothetical protein J0I06_06010 [Planctomycetes bacterium]|nr:hypothetical protein [Planctomycetota bacterium]
MGVEVLVIGDDGIRPLEALAAEASALQTALANCKVRLFQSTLSGPSEFTNLAALDAAEATFSGYTTGGVTVTAAGEPYIDLEASNMLVPLPSVQFNFLTPEEGDPVTNTIGGAYVVDSAGKLRGVQKFSSNRVMSGDLNSIQVAISFRVKN